ncbi:hypothetical protein LOZ66_003807 [Ophidiomyces ophidiicola]|nr:hypothetical protein LOZ66_003807 [Ophidiomyces ophidiicola]
MIVAPRPVQNPTKTEGKDQQTAAYPPEDSLRGIFSECVYTQAFSINNNKEALLSCALDDSFHAGLSLTPKEGEPSPRHWSDLSNIQTAEILCSDTLEAFDSANGLEEGDYHNTHSEFLFGDRKKLVSRSSSIFRQRAAYKYEDPPAIQASDHKLADDVDSIRKQASPSALTYSPQRRSFAMAYQEHWHNRFPPYSFPAVHDPISLPPAPSISVQRDYITPAVEPHRGCGQPIPAHTPATQYGTGVVSQTEHSTTPTACAEPCPRYLEGSTSSPVTALSSISPPVILRSQSDPGPNPWPSHSLDASMYSYSSSDHPPLEGQSLWNLSSLPNRSIPTYGHIAYPTAVMAPIPQRLQNRMNHAVGPVQENGLAIHVDHRTKMSPVSVSTMRISPPSCPAPSAGQSYPLELDSLPRSSHFDPLHYSTPPSHVPSFSPVVTQPTMAANRVTHVHKNLHRPSNSCRHSASFQRRTHPRKPPSVPKAGKAISTHNPTNTTNVNKNPVDISFVNLTPNDSHKLLTGVAPSGSSKTKARREQEAREKRELFTSNAIRAVQMCGGDVEGLKTVLN